MESRQTTLDEYWFKKIPEDICNEIIDNILKEKSDEELAVIQSPDASVHASDGEVSEGYLTPPPDDSIVEIEKDTPSPNWRNGKFGENVLNYKWGQSLQNPEYDGYNSEDMGEY
tara:strand:- start:519 stop:860 length:342 start_codon:yes stop_codon:yes gene_type:complete